MKTIRTYINAAEAGFASSLLESAGIQTLLSGQESFLLTPGLVTGGIQLQVEEEETERALRLLDEGFDKMTDASNGAEELEAPAAPESAEGGRIPTGLFVAVAGTLALLLFAAHQWNERRRVERATQATQRYESDYDHDGRPDHFSFYRHGIMERAEVDQNGDGRVDAWETYDGEGRLERCELDQNFDGQVDFWSSYRNGQIRDSQRDPDFDGRPDWFGAYEHGQMVREDCRPGDSAIVIRRLVVADGVLREELVDENRDGAFDYKILYDPFASPSGRLPVDAAK